ncbi:MAG: hypothetical protein ACR2PB_11175 [Desulfocapsaceae bacterium]
MKIASFSLEAPPYRKATISEDRVLFWWMLILILVRLWFVQSQGFIATYTPHDDYLFIRLAKGILSGGWLGPYDQFTLIKGPGYPLFIAFAHHIGIPLLLAQQLLYSFFCVMMISAVRPLVKNRWLLITVFTFMLLNPFMYAYPATGRAFRLGLSMPLVLAVFSCMLGLVIRIDASFRSKFVWASGFGFFATLLWFTREEGIWLLPGFGLFVIIFLITDNGFSRKLLFQRFLLLIWVAAIFASFYGSITYFNYKVYGHALVNELKSPQFQSALGGLMNIDTSDAKRYVPVSREAKKLAYAASPTFRILKPYFEADRSLRWPNSFYIWRLRDRVEMAGYSKNLTDALDFYEKMGAELREACENGSLSCFDRKPSLRPPWRAEYNEYIWPYFSKVFLSAITFSNLDEDTILAQKYISSGTTEMVEDYTYVTLETPVTSRRKVMNNYPDYFIHMTTEKFRILSDMAKAYKSVIVYLFSLAVFIHLVLFLREAWRRRFSVEVLYGFVVLGSLFSLVSVLSFVYITLWPITRPLFSAYPVILFYIALVVILLFRAWQKEREEAMLPYEQWRAE